MLDVYYKTYKNNLKQKKIRLKISKNKSFTKHVLLLDHNLIDEQVLTYQYQMDVYLIQMHHLIFQVLEE